MYMPTLEEIRKAFANDRFATEAAGCQIRTAEPRHAICVMPLKPIHMNAAGTPQGGAVFTLATLLLLLLLTVLVPLSPFLSSMTSLILLQQEEVC